MRQQIRIQSVRGSIGPVWKANGARRERGRARRGQRRGTDREPEEAAGAGRRGGTHRTREEKKRKKAKRKRSEGSRVFDLCNLAIQVKNKSKTPAPRRRRRRRREQKGRRAEPSFKRYPDVAKWSKVRHSPGGYCSKPNASRDM